MTSRNGAWRLIVMFLMNRQSGISKVPSAVLLILCLTLLAGCHSPQQPGSGNDWQTEIIPGTLIITGNGVEHPTRLSLDELQEIEEARASACYSAVNNWPARKFMVGQGIKVSYLLKKAGIKDEAQTIIVRAADGYNAAFTREQLDEKRFCFPDLLENSEKGAQEVPAILAWEYRQGRDLTKAITGNLCLLLGQKSLNDVVAHAFIKDVVMIEVLTAPPGQWAAVQAETAPGRIKGGTEILLSHPDQDLVKIYYTIDGSTPDRRSLVYNPSTSYYQPDLTKPIKVDNDMVIKAIAIGLGKHDSEAATFEYEAE